MIILLMFISPVLLDRYRTPIVNRSVEVALGEYQKASSEIQHQYPIRILEHIEQSIRRISEVPIILMLIYLFQCWLKSVLFCCSIGSETSDR